MFYAYGPGQQKAAAAATATATAAAAAALVNFSALSTIAREDWGGRRPTTEQPESKCRAAGSLSFVMGLYSGSFHSAKGLICEREINKGRGDKWPSGRAERE